MIKLYSSICLMVMMGALLVFTGCGKKKSTLEQPSKPPAQVDTSFNKVKAIAPDTSDNTSFKEAQLSEELRRLAAEKLKTVYFAFNSFTLSSEAIAQLEIAAAFLREHQNLRVVIEGNCDDRGSPEYNIGLGENRAKVVKDYLVNYGIANNRLETTSWGEERLAVTNCRDDNCHGKNRRDEFKVLQ